MNAGMFSLYNRYKTAWLVIWTGLMIFLLLAVGVFQPALAKGIIFQGDVPAGEVVENDLFLLGESPTIDGRVIGDVFVLGNRVAINGEIDGSLFLLGQTAQIESQVQGTVFSASLEMGLGPEAALQRNLYYVGLSLITQAGSSIGRDLVAWCFGAQLDGSVQRDVIAVIGPLELLNAVLELLDAPPLRLSEAAQISALPAWRLSASAGMLGWAGWQAVQSATHTPETSHIQDAQQAGGIDWMLVGSWLLDRFKELVVLFVFGLLAAWLFPRRLKGSGLALEKKPLPALGYGLLGLVLAVNIFGVAMLLAVIFLIVGLFIGTLDLWALSLAFWALAYPALALATALFWLFVAYGTKVIVAYFVGSWLLGRLSPKAAHRILAILIGLLLYVLLVSIPMIGWVLAVLVTTFGIGAAWLDLRSRNATQAELGSSGPEPVDMEPGPIVSE